MESQLFLVHKLSVYPPVCLSIVSILISRIHCTECCNMLRSSPKTTPSSSFSPVPTLYDESTIMAKSPSNLLTFCRASAVVVAVVCAV